MDLADELEREHGITASDRRWRQATSLVRASAVLDGRDVATPRDLSILAQTSNGVCASWRAPLHWHHRR